jgi:hypothetical protein
VNLVESFVWFKNHAKLFGGLLIDYERPSKNAKVNQQHNLTKKETEVSLKLIIMLLMKYKQLTYEQRYAIYLDLKEGTSKKNIALRIGVHISVACLKRWGLQASFLSPDTNADAG